MPKPIALLVLLVLCAGCSKPEPPPTELPPEPQAPAAPADDAQATQLRDAINEPIDRARAVEDAVLDAADKRKAAIEAQAGG